MSEPGLNQWTWDLRHGGLNCIDDVALFAGFGGASVTPGNYQLLVTVGDSQSTASITLLPDPRSAAFAEDYEFLAARLVEITDLKVQWAERKAELADITATDIATVNDWASANGVPHATPPIN